MYTITCLWLIVVLSIAGGVFAQINDGSGPGSNDGINNDGSGPGSNDGINNDGSGPGSNDGINNDGSGPGSNDGINNDGSSDYSDHSNSDFVPVSDMDVFVIVDFYSDDQCTQWASNIEYPLGRCNEWTGVCEQECYGWTRSAIGDEDHKDSARLFTCYKDWGITYSQWVEYENCDGEAMSRSNKEARVGCCLPEPSGELWSMILPGNAAALDLCPPPHSHLPGVDSCEEYQDYDFSDVICTGEEEPHSGEDYASSDSSDDSSSSSGDDVVVSDDDYSATSSSDDAASYDDDVSSADDSSSSAAIVDDDTSSTDTDKDTECAEDTIAFDSAADWWQFIMGSVMGIIVVLSLQHCNERRLAKRRMAMNQKFQGVTLLTPLHQSDHMTIHEEGEGDLLGHTASEF